MRADKTLLPPESNAVVTFLGWCCTTRTIPHFNIALIGMGSMLLNLLHMRRSYRVTTRAS
jgi:hypothetical protein